MVAAMSERAPGARLHSVTGRFHRPVGGAFAVEAAVARTGRTITGLSAQATTEKGVHAEATAIYGTAPSGGWPVFAPEPPAAPPPEECELFAIPPEFVPISVYMQIRPVGPNRPYAGGKEPELTAWIRLVEDDRPPDLLRFILLMDALAPAYAAVLSDLVLVPTVEFTVRPGDALATAASPWVLLRARTRAAGPDGWNEEEIDAWGPDGAHLGSARQLRVARSA
ncbi:thioesterase family protein [Actinomadura craniellae]|uniref:Thioesterase family protein n=2 Tax=Actinomadura craniellae TaxID=2231787 RepID=A0A365GZR8_9ACTN|nr:thioesterase family protein [Actinomadura craniellae]